MNVKEYNRNPLYVFVYIHVYVCMYTLGFNNEILIILVVVINRKRLSLKKCYKYHKLL